MIFKKLIKSKENKNILKYIINFGYKIDTILNMFIGFEIVSINNIKFVFVYITVV